MVSNRRAAAGAVHLARAVHQASGPGSPSLIARLRAVPRLVRAVRSGEYTGMSSMHLALVLAGVGYVVSPIDIAPEGLLLAFGLLDDVMVIGWVAATLVKETEDFIAWEQAVAAHGGFDQHAQQQWAGSQDARGQQWEEPIRSYVVND